MFEAAEIEARRLKVESDYEDELSAWLWKAMWSILAEARRKHSDVMANEQSHPLFEMRRAKTSAMVAASHRMITEHNAVSESRRYASTNHDLLLAASDEAETF